MGNARSFFPTVSGRTSRLLSSAFSHLVSLGLLAALAGCASSTTCYKRYDSLKGETIKSVCAKFGLTEEELRRANHMSRGYALKPGERLFLPCSAEERKVEAGPTVDVDRVRVQGGQAPPSQGEGNMKAPAKNNPSRVGDGPGGSRFQTSTAKPARIQEKPPPARKKLSEPTQKPAQEAKKATGGLRFAWPLDGKVLRNFSEGKEDGTNGVDIRATKGCSITASEAGRVEYAGTPADAYGPMVLLAHGDGFYTVYSRLGGLSVSTGDKVVKGRKIATAGVENYVHFEVRYGADPLDPLLYLPRR